MSSTLATGRRPRWYVLDTCYFEEANHRLLLVVCVADGSSSTPPRHQYSTCAANIGRVKPAWPMEVATCPTKMPPAALRHVDGPTTGLCTRTNIIERSMGQCRTEQRPSTVPALGDGPRMDRSCVVPVVGPMFYGRFASREVAACVCTSTPTCQGHNRCYAIAPELFDVDDLGYAHELNDGVVPAEHEEQARLAVANCPEHAIELSEERMSAPRRPVTDWATDFDHTDPQWVADPVSRSGTSCARQCPVAHSDRYGGTWLPGPPRRRRRGRVRHRALHVAFGRRERAPSGRRRPARADRHRAADHLRPAVPRAGAPAAAARVRAEGDRGLRAVHA